MSQLALIPWFFTYDLALDVLFAVISLSLSLFAFKIFKVTAQKQARFFGISFLFIGLSYFVQFFFSIFKISFSDLSSCKEAWFFSSCGFYLPMMLMIAGFMILMYTTFEIKNRSVLCILLLISLVGLFLSSNPLLVYYLVLTLILAFIAGSFVKKYFEKKQVLSLVTAIAFLFLLFGSIHFLFSLNHQVYYVLGRFFELIAYLLILVNVYLVLKR